MNVLVCLKQILDPTLVQFNIQSSELEAPRSCLNELDAVALEQALRLKGAHGGSVSVVSVGDDATDAVLRQGLVSGADRAVRVWGAAAEHADAYVVAELLAAVARRLSPDLILCGARSADVGAESVAAHLAAALELPFVTRAVALECLGGSLTVDVREEKGWRERLQTNLPAVVGVEAALSEPRYIPILSRTYKRGILTPIESWDTDELLASSEQITPLVLSLGVTQPRPRTKVGVKVTQLSMADKIRLMRGGGGKQQQRELVTGTPEESARAIVARLGECLQ
jgi:electron transfer flavoprotein beta subunit